LRCTWIALLVIVPTASAQDTVRVRGSGVPAWPKISLTQVMSIGEIDGPPEVAFGSIQAFTADWQNRFYTYDGKDKQIRAYDATGKFLRLIGRSGAGPGEYKWVFGMGILSDSILALFDISNARITFFHPSGKLLRTLPQPRATNGFDHGFAVDHSGLLTYRVPPKVGGASDVELPVEGPSKGMKVSDGYALRINAEGSLVDSIPIPPPGPQQRGFYLMGADGGNLNFMSSYHAAVSPAGAVVFGQSSSYRFVIRPAKGPVRVVEHPWTPVPVGSAERANWMEWVEYFRKRDNNRFNYTIPRTKPAYRDLFADQDGRIWVSVYTATEKRNIPPRPAGDLRPRLVWRQNATYDVFDPMGVYLARVALEPNSQLLWAQRDRIWVLAKGADDEERIISYRLTGMTSR
jgi:hypothetical protein